MDKWSVDFEMELDNSFLDEEVLFNILSDSGKRSGVGDYRPQRGGSFGRFILTSWEKLKEREEQRLKFPGKSIKKGKNESESRVV